MTYKQSLDIKELNAVWWSTRDSTVAGSDMAAIEEIPLRGVSSHGKIEGGRNESNPRFPIGEEKSPNGGSQGGNEAGAISNKVCP